MKYLTKGPKLRAKANFSVQPFFLIFFSTILLNFLCFWLAFGYYFLFVVIYIDQLFPPDINFKRRKQFEKVT